MTSVAALNMNSSYGMTSFGLSIEGAFNATTQKIKDALISPIGQGIMGFGLGVGVHQIYGPLTVKVVNFLGITAFPPDPFSRLGLRTKILISPVICVLGPIIEEKMFRGDIQEKLKARFKAFNLNRGFSDSAANTAARIASVFFGSILFGVIHFSNALLFWCNPYLFLPQVVAATIMGLLFGLAKEVTGDLHMPHGMHIGNNTFAWAHYIRQSL